MQDNPTPNPNPIPPPPIAGMPTQRRRSRGWIVAGVIVGLLVVIIGVFALFVGMFLSSFESEHKVDVTDKTVLVLDLSKGVPEYEPPMALSFSGDDSGPSLRDIILSIDHAATDEKIHGIYIRSGIAGAGMAKLNEIRDALLAFKRSGKFIYAYMEMGTKGGYYLATVADSIIMPQEGMMEFNAFGVSAPFMRGMFEKLGVSFHVEQFEEYKSAAESMNRDNWSEPAKEELRALLQQRSSMFVDAVASSRKLNPERIVALMNKGVYIPDSLLTSGLIDAMMREAELKERIHRRMNPEDKSPHPSLKTISLANYAQSFDERNADDRAAKSIAIVYASGAISPGKKSDPFTSEGIYARTLIKDLRAARDNDDISAIVLRIDSPGGSAFASDEIWAEILEVRKTKPVYASMSDVAASGGYYIAMACDTIIAHPSTITGSIGVIMSIPNFTGSVAKVGITIDTVSLGPSASFMNAGLPLTDSDKRTLRAFGQGIYTRFVQKVAQSRKMDTAAARKLARGRVWTGAAAKDAGLVDMLGGLDVAVATAKKRIGLAPTDDVNIVLYPKKIDNLSALLKLFGIDKDDDDEDVEVRTALRSTLMAKITGTVPAAEQIYRSLPAGTRSQVQHTLQLTQLGVTERALMMLPMTVPMD